MQLITLNGGKAEMIAPYFSSNKRIGSTSNKLREYADFDSFFILEYDSVRIAVTQLAKTIKFTAQKA